MFNYPMNDKNSSARRAPFRMTTLRHNPYVGSFHSAVIPTSSTDAIFEATMRESPSELGLKRILYQKNDVRPTVLTQMKVNRVSTSFPVKRSFLQSLKKIPLKVYSSSAGSKSTVSFHGDDPDGPVCAICIEPYVDGDQLLTLSCSHCFHNECARKWFLQGCLNNADGNPVNCPECRQHHRQQSDADTVSASTSVMGGIPSASFFDLGTSLMQEGGYDLMSDVGSETSRTIRSVSMTNLLDKCNIVESMMEPSGDGSFCLPCTEGPAAAATTADPSLEASTITRTTADTGTAAASEPSLAQSSLTVATKSTETTVSTAATQPSVGSPAKVRFQGIAAGAAAAPPLEVIEEGSYLKESTYSDCGYPLVRRG